MSEQRRVTAPPGNLAEAVTNSLRSDVSRNRVSFSSGPPPGDRRERDLSPQRIFFATAIPSPSAILPGFPL